MIMKVYFIKVYSFFLCMFDNFERKMSLYFETQTSMFLEDSELKLTGSIFHMIVSKLKVYL